VKERAPRVGNPGKLRDRLDGPQLVVGVHDRDDRRVVGQRLFEGLRLDDPGCSDRQQRGLPAAAGEGLEGDQDRLVLDGRGDEVFSAGRLQGLGRSPQRKIVGLGPAAGEYKF
jgi:hypothetical protein